MKKTIFIKNAAILTVSSLFLRFAGISFKVWLASKVGAEGIGLYQLVFSVYMFAATFATSGICTAVTRLVSEALALGNKNGVKKIVNCCVFLSCLVATISILFLFLGAEYISVKLLHQPAASLSLKVLSFSLPFMGICSCFKGYFIARRKAAPSSVSQLLEQAVRIAVVVFLITRFNKLDTKYACAVILLGDTIAEAISCVYIYLKYQADYKRLKPTTINTLDGAHLLASISHIALPITSGKYLNSLLRTAENVLVPICLSRFGNNGIGLFGTIKGMALPLLFFPSSLLGAISTLLLPEIAESSARGKKGVMRSVVYQIIKITSLVSIIFSALFWVAGQKLGVLIYNSRDVGFLLYALSPIVPFMYLDAISDGILKGLDQQKFTFYISILDSTIRIALVLLLLKKFGIYGFIGIMYFSNFFTCALNLKRLAKASGINLNPSSNFIIPLCCAFSLCLFAKVLLNCFRLPELIYVILICVICVPLYFILLFLLNVINHDDINMIIKK